MLNFSHLPAVEVENRFSNVIPRQHLNSVTLIDVIIVLRVILRLEQMSQHIILYISFFITQYTYYIIFGIQSV